MKIYFAGAIRGGREDAGIYQAIIACLRAFGDVLTEHVGDPGLTVKGDDGPDDRHIHDRDMAWLQSADLVVAEVSRPSLGVGYELGWACALGKPILCLHRPVAERPLSAMIAGGPGMTVRDYSRIHEAEIIIREFINNSQLTMNYFPISN